MIRKTANEELGRLSPGEFRSVKKGGLHVILDNIRSALNVGSIFRSADGFLIEKIWICGISARPPHREIHKTALGATESVNWEYVKDPRAVVIRLQTSGIPVYALEQSMQALAPGAWVNKHRTDTKAALILGNEVEGVQDELMALVDGAIELPMSGTKHSLNVSVAAGIAFWEWYCKDRSSECCVLNSEIV